MSQSSSYSAPQVSHVGDVRDLTQGSGTYMSDSSTGYGYFPATTAGTSTPPIRWQTCPHGPEHRRGHSGK